MANALVARSNLRQTACCISYNSSLATVSYTVINRVDISFVLKVPITFLPGGRSRINVQRSQEDFVRSLQGVPQFGTELKPQTIFEPRSSSYFRPVVNTSCVDNYGKGELVQLVTCDQLPTQNFAQLVVRRQFSQKKRRV